MKKHIVIGIEWSQTRLRGHSTTLQVLRPARDVLPISVRVNDEHREVIEVLATATIVGYRLAGHVPIATGEMISVDVGTTPIARGRF